MHKNKSITILAAVFAGGLLAACSPKYNWRDYASPEGHYRTMFPTKPASYTRQVDLDGMKVDMTMTASEVDDTMFAVGSAVAPDAAHAQAALQAMKTAMVRNIGATITSEKNAAAASASGTSSTQSAAIDIDAAGASNGEPVRLVGHFEARDKRLYQVVVIGKAHTMEREQVKQFISSFKPQ